MSTTNKNTGKMRIRNNNSKFSIPQSNKEALVKGYNKNSFNNRRNVFEKRQPTTNSVRLNNYVVNANDRNNNNSVKQALDEKIKNEFDNKTYDLIVHFKGFNELFLNGVYNGYSRETLENIGLTDVDKKSHIEDIAREYLHVIKTQMDGILSNKNLLLVWDGDGLDDFQWTRVMIATAQKLVEQGANIEFLCIPENETKLNNIREKLSEISDLKDKEIKFILQNEINIDSVGWAVAGMCNMYVTSKINRNDNQPILVLCAGGGQTPLDEYKFMNQDFKPPDWETDQQNILLYKQVINLADDDMRQKFKWMASSKVRSRKNKNNGVELSKMTRTNGIEMINSIQSGVKLTGRDGARKKRTKTLKKKKSLKKKSKKNKSKSKSKRKC